jgi:hypothetical protein
MTMVLVMPSRMPQSSAGVWRVPPIDEEEVADRAFGQFVLPIQKQAVEGAGCNRFTFGKNIVQEIGGLNLRRQRFGKIAPGLGDGQSHPVA